MRPKTNEDRVKRGKEIREYQKQYNKERKEMVINITINITCEKVDIMKNGDDVR